MEHVFFITVLRALAACVITNSHYEGVYPVGLLASGGLLGDVLFFAVSGFCLARPRVGLPRWYARRAFRIYPAVWIASLAYLALGFTSLDPNLPTAQALLKTFLWPTKYHFVGSILLLYFPFYFVSKNEFLKKRISLIMLALLAIQLAVYCIFYDATRYRIDSVREPMILFLFFQSMLLGAFFSERKDFFLNKNVRRPLLALPAVAALYFASKLFFSRHAEFAPFQIANQIALFGLLYLLLRGFAGLDARLNRLPAPLKRAIAFLAELTLEIYVVQYEIIPRLAGLAFPLNWLCITAAILLSAWLVHRLAGQVQKLEALAFPTATPPEGREGGAA